MEAIEFNVLGKPIPKQRPRKGKYGNIYTPTKTKNYEELIGMSFKLNAGSGFKPFESHVTLTIINVCKFPKKFNKEQRERASSGSIRPVSRPDIDNIIKSVMDGLNGVAFKDDSQVVNITAGKIYGNENYIQIIVKGDNQ